MGIQINGATDTISASDGSLSVSSSESTFSGIATFTSGLNVTGGNVTGNINSSGVSTVTTLNATTISGVSTIGVTTATVTTLTVNGNAYPSDGPLSNRNILINGGMTVCQRFGLNTANNINNATHTYHVDRFKAYNDNTGILQGEWVNTEFPEGFRYSLKYTPATADTSMGTSQMSFISYVIEEKDFERFRWGTSDAQQLTLSFKVKTNKAGTYCVAFFNANTFDRYYITEVSITDTTNWNDVTITVPGDTTGTWSMMRINWTLAVASNLQGSADTWGSGTLYGTSNQVNFMDSTSNEFYLTGVQLEVGSVATPFEHRSYGEELALCQRYYQILEIPTNTYGAQYATVGSGLFAGLPLTFITKMRTAPTSVTYEHVSGTEYWVQVSTTSFSGTGGAGRTFASTDSSVRMHKTRVSGNNTPSGSSYYVWEATFKLLLSSEL